MAKRKTRNKKSEQVLSQRVTNLMLLDYPKVPFRFDVGADMPLPPMYHKRMKDAHGKWSRGYPDMFIATGRGGYGGLYIELKATEKVENNEHTRRQAVYHSVLRRNGYYVKFSCGYDETKKIIKTYMKLKKNKVIK